MESRIKPYGLGWLEILAVLTGLLLVPGGLSLMSGLGTSSEGPEVFGFGVSAWFGYLGMGVLLQQWSLLGVMLIVLGIVYFLAAIGLFFNRQWAWTLSIGLSILGIASSVEQIAVVEYIGISDWLALFVAIAALYYLTRPRVRSFFHHARMNATDNERLDRQSLQS